MTTSKSLKTAVKGAVKSATTAAQTGNEQTIDEGPATIRKAATGQAVQDLPTGQRRNLPG